MKNIIALVLAITLIFSSMAPSKSIASNDKDLKLVIEKAKNTLNIGEEYKSFDYSVYKEEGVTLYNLNWKDVEETKFISATIDSEGFIMGYDHYSNDDNYENKIPKISEEQGKDISEKFIKSINPKIKENIKYRGNDELDGSYVNKYYFNFVRTENGIPYANNMANVNVDRITGEIKNFYITWDKDLNFPDDKDIISKDQADKIYKEKVRFELMYKYDYTGKEAKPKLVYSLVDKNKSIDAKTGELMDYSNDYLYRESMAVSESMDKAKNNDKQLTQEELEAIKNSKQIIGENEAENIARQNLKIDESYELSYLSLSKENDEYRWYLDFNKQEKNNYSGVYASIDAKTKEIIHFNKFNEDGTSKVAKYSREEALKIAQEYLSKTQNKKSKEVEYIDTGVTEAMLFEGEIPRQYSFKFVRKINGILFEGDGFDIRVDPTDGEIVGYNTSWYNKELPSSEAVISKEKAYSVFTSKAKLELQYIRVPKEGKNKDTKLAYSLSGGYNLDVDSVTGKIINLYSYFGNNQDKPNYSDIENSIAKKQINALLDLNIYLPGDKFEPKKEINQEDFLYLLAISKENYINYGDTNELYKLLINQKIVKKEEKSPEYNMTREEAVKYIVRYLGYSKVADIEGIYKLDFKDSEDIDPKLRGYVAITKGLGIVGGTKDGRFKPTDKLTREQAIMIIYNILDGE